MLNRIGHEYARRVKRHGAIVFDVRDLRDGASGSQKRGRCRMARAGMVLRGERN